MFLSCSPRQFTSWPSVWMEEHGKKLVSIYRIVYIFRRRPCRRNLAKILKPNILNYLVIGRVMPDITPEDIEAIRKTEHPTESLLKVWGSKGYKIVDLFKVFGLCQYAKCTDILKPFVDPKFHNITLTTDRSILSPKSVPQSDNVLQKSELTQQSVYSKRTPSQIEPLLISQG